MKPITTRELIPFKGEEFEIEVTSFECVDTGKRFGSADMTDAIVDKLHFAWRQRHKVPSPEQLKEAREKLGLSLRAMSKFLGLGINQYRYYEGGELPKPSHQLLLKLLVSQGALPHILAIQSDRLPKKTLKAFESFIRGDRNVIEVERTPKVNNKPVGANAELDGDLYRDGECASPVLYDELTPAAA